MGFCECLGACPEDFYFEPLTLRLAQPVPLLRELADLAEVFGGPKPERRLFGMG